MHDGKQVVHQPGLGDLILQQNLKDINHLWYTALRVTTSLALRGHLRFEGDDEDSESSTTISIRANSVNSKFTARWFLEQIVKRMINKKDK